ncbi:MAG: FkbM family methyltransferase [Bacteroidetes bacterium]|nr:FkbM family methyltransferase [Bacteroidota bacterium]
MDIYFKPMFTNLYKDFPIVLIDVGASGGLERNWLEAEQHLKIIGFEPDERAYSDLMKKKNNMYYYFNIALGGEKTATPFYLTEKQQTSSVYRPNYKFLNNFPEVERFNLVGDVELETDTLDNIAQHSFSRADFIKLDTQGSELSILEGGKEILSNEIFGIEIEIEFADIYENQPLFADVDKVIREFGFHLFDIQRCNWKRISSSINYGKKGQLIFGNALYFKKPENFKQTVRKIKDINYKKSKVLNAISICLLYGYVDYAYEIFNANNNIFKLEESKSITIKLKKITSLGNYIPNFKGKARLSNLFYNLGDIFCTGNRYWSKNDRKLGNR